MSIEKILVVDDEELIRDFLKETLKRKKYEVTACANGAEALVALKEEQFDLIFTDMKMPGLTGLDVIKKVKKASPSTMVIVITGFGTIENAVDAMRAGAFNYLIKPFSPDIIHAVVEKAQEHASLVGENAYLRGAIKAEASGGVEIIAESAAMKKVLAEVKEIAKSSAAVFISGESGTGKEVIAAAIAAYSTRSDKPYIRVNCAAMSETLIESEFFGHEKGAFTGASAKKPGRFELADKGTLLLDEITEIPPALQAKLLRVTQEQEFERVGGTKLINVDVRLISTSNRDIRQAIREKALREDLYYRLSVIPIFLPPLRNRPEDILPLAENFLKKYCIENHKEQKSLSPSAQEKLLAYPWPGNVRELGNIIERAVVIDRGPEIQKEHLILESIEEAKGEILSLRELERRHIIEALQSQNRDCKKAAVALGISEKDLLQRLRELQIKN